MYDEHMYEKLHTPLRMVVPPYVEVVRGALAYCESLPEAEPSPLSVELVSRVPHSWRARELTRGSRGQCPNRKHFGFRQNGHVNVINPLFN